MTDPDDLDAITDRAIELADIRRDTVDEPLTGIIHGLDEHTYHAHPALSSTGARDLLKAPAVFAHNRAVPRADTAAFDVGSAAHAKVLGVGAPIAVIPASVLASNGAVSTAAAKEFIAASREAGSIPLKAAVAAEIDELAEAILRNSRARELLEMEGDSEVSGFATDPTTGIPLRMRADRLSKDHGTLIDLKTTDDASRHGFEKTVGKFRYDVQEAWYSDILAFIDGSRPHMDFIVVEKKPPHLVAVHRLSDEFADIGEHYARKARAIYAACLEHDLWPGLATKQDELMPPFWLTAQYMESRVE